MQEDFYEVRTMGQMLDSYLNPTSEQLEQRRKREQSYRRGFHQGWDDALEAIFDLWKSGISRQEAWKMATSHVNRLAEWRVEESNRMVPPPRLHQKQERKDTSTGEQEDEDI